MSFHTHWQHARRDKVLSDMCLTAGSDSWEHALVGHDAKDGEVAMDEREAWVQFSRSSARDGGSHSWEQASS